jgi:hypothetical protein
VHPDQNYQFSLLDTHEWMSVRSGTSSGHVIESVLNFNPFPPAAERGVGRVQYVFRVAGARLRARMEKLN